MIASTSFWPVIQGASLELSPPLLHSYIVKGVTVPVTHPVLIPVKLIKKDLFSVIEYVRTQLDSGKKSPYYVKNWAENLILKKSFDFQNIKNLIHA